MEREDYQRHVLVRIFQLSNALQTVIDQTLDKEPITAKQFFMMIMIGSFGYDPKLGELSERFKTSHQNTKQVLLKLEKVGFVEMYKDKEDSRILRCRLTEKAESFWQSRNIEDVQTLNSLFEDLTVEELKETNSGILKLLETVERYK